MPHDSERGARMAQHFEDLEFPSDYEESQPLPGLLRGFLFGALAMLLIALIHAQVVAGVEAPAVCMAPGFEVEQ